MVTPGDDTDAQSGTEAMHASQPIAVLGLMGAGKTTVARALAEALDRPLRDSDPDLQALRGIDAATLASTEGTEALHAWEAEHVLRSLAERPPVVLAAAASTVEVAECRHALEPAFVIWLDAPTAVLAGRFDSSRHRPRFGKEVVELLEQQIARRRPFLVEVADVVVDASFPQDQVCAEALAAVRRADGRVVG